MDQILKPQNLDSVDTQDPQNLAPSPGQNSQSNQVDLSDHTQSTQSTQSTRNTQVTQTPQSSQETETASSDSQSASSSIESVPDLENLMDELSNYDPEEDINTDSPIEQNVAQSENLVSDKPSFSPSTNLSPSATISAIPTSSSPIVPHMDNPLLDSSVIPQADLASDTQSASSSITNVAGSTNSDSASENSEETDSPSEGERPLVAATPVPGSIGSAVSYADVEKKQAEEALKQSKNQNKPKIKFTRTTILVLVGVALLVISGIVFAFMMLTKPKQTPTEASGKNAVAGSVVRTLSCIRPLNTNESASVGASYGNFEKFYSFRDDRLVSLNETYIYQFDNESQALSAKKTLDDRLGIVSSPTVESKTDSENKTDDSSSSSSSKSSPKTVKTDGLTQIETILEGNQVKKITYVPEDNLENYLKDNTEYSSISERNLKTFLKLQNQSGLSCNTTE